MASQLLMGLAGVIIARSLGPSGKGAITAVTTWMQTLSWLALAGLSTSMSVRVASSGGAGLGVVLGNVVAYSIVIGGAVSVGAVLYIRTIFASLGPGTETIAAVAFATVPAAVASDILIAINIALGRTHVLNLCRLVGPLLLLGGTVVLNATHLLTVGRVVLLTLLSSFAALALAVANLPWRHLRVDLSVLRSDLRFGLKIHFATLIGLANTRLDLLALSTFASAAQIGLYSVANNVMIPVGTLAAAAATLLTPAVARMHLARSGLASVQVQQIALIRQDAARYLAIATGSGLALAVAAPVLIPAVFGSAFAPAVVLVWILIPGYVARSYALIVAAGTAGMRRPWVGNVIEGVAAVVAITLLPLLLPKLAAVGAAVSLTSASVAGSLMAFFAAGRIATRPGTSRRAVLDDSPHRSVGRESVAAS